MPIKMIVTDLDRTLLRTDKTISDYTENVLNHCRQKGIKIVFATARPKRTVKHFIEQIPSDALILHNGAAIFAGDKLIKKYGIASQTKNNIMLSISKDYPNASLSVEIDDVLYANFDVSSIWNYTQAIRTDFTDLPDKPADKIIIGVTSMEDVKRYSKYLTDELYIEMNDGKLGLIMHRNATKWRAIQIISHHFKINKNEIAAFGDDYNDIEMLKNCGVGVAVENALDEAKAVSDFVCESNDNDGVARWIEVNVL